MVPVFDVNVKATCDQVFTVNPMLETYSTVPASPEMNMDGRFVSKLDKIHVTVFEFAPVSNVISLPWGVIETKLT